MRFMLGRLQTACRALEGRGQARPYPRAATHEILIVLPCEET